MEFSVKISSEHSSAISSLESFFVKPAESPGTFDCNNCTSVNSAQGTILYVVRTRVVHNHHTLASH